MNGLIVVLAATGFIASLVCAAYVGFGMDSSRTLVDLAIRRTDVQDVAPAPPPGLLARLAATAHKLKRPP